MESVEDDKRSGRPQTSRTAENMETVSAVVRISWLAKRPSSYRRDNMCNYSTTNRVFFAKNGSPKEFGREAPSYRGPNMCTTNRALFVKKRPEGVLIRDSLRTSYASVTTPKSKVGASSVRRVFSSIRI
ncbi:hypothetical protein TNCV_1627291 [Trichonephila clavipes]|nr:hypothetical protein TNCV_1627291 [Trichonephila clavipes]